MDSLYTDDLGRCTSYGDSSQSGTPRLSASSAASSPYHSSSVSDVDQPLNHQAPLELTNSTGGMCWLPGESSSYLSDHTASTCDYGFSLDHLAGPTPHSSPSTLSMRSSSSCGAAPSSSTAAAFPSALSTSACLPDIAVDTGLHSDPAVVGSSLHAMKPVSSSLSPAERVVTALVHVALWMTAVVAATSTVCRPSTSVGQSKQVRAQPSPTVSTVWRKVLVQPSLGSMEVINTQHPPRSTATPAAVSAVMAWIGWICIWLHHHQQQHQQGQARALTPCSASMTSCYPPRHITWDPHSRRSSHPPTTSSSSSTNSLGWLTWMAASGAREQYPAYPLSDGAWYRSTVPCSSVMRQSACVS